MTKILVKNWPSSKKERSIGRAATEKLCDKATSNSNFQNLFRFREVFTANLMWFDKFGFQEH